MEPRTSGRMVFSAPSLLDLPRSRPVRCRSRAANMRIKYMFIVQRYGLMPAAGFCTAMWSLTGIVALGGSDPEGRGGKARG
jgi:hypothetical protein